MQLIKRFMAALSHDTSLVSGIDSMYNSLVNLKVIAFDFDGTLADTLPLCIASYQALTEEITGTRPSAEEVESYFGLSDSGLLAGLLHMDPQSPDLPLQRLVEIYCELHPLYAPKPFEGALEVLDALQAQGLELALVTGKEVHTALPSLRYFQLEPYFSWRGYGEATFNAKSLRFQELMQEKNLQKNELLYVGDAPSDITCCHEAGIAIINAAWAADSPRYEDECLRLKPEYRLDQISQIPHLIAKLNKMGRG